MEKAISVSEINRYIKEMFSNDFILSNLWIRGEISNYKNHYSGHMYFTLKDEKSIIKCVMFKSQASGLKFEPANGMKVIIRGYISVFERDGQYQVYAQEMQPDGIGSLHMAFEQLKKKLEEEGLFDERRKKKLPFIPGSIGVVTSITGAVLRDIINVLNRRFANYELKVYPVQVQGETAAGSIARAINRLNELECVDVIIVARGGGSLEELWAFNEETVARSVYNSRIPVISAVGHETDFTICDFAADFRAPTPSAAAEIVLPEKAPLMYAIKNLDERLSNSIRNTINTRRMKLEKLVHSAAFRQPYNIVYQSRLKMDALNKDIHRALKVRWESSRSHLALLAGKLDTLSPLQILSRGYSITRRKSDGGLVRTISDTRAGEGLKINVRDGMIMCMVEDLEGNCNGNRQ